MTTPARRQPAGREPAGRQHRVLVLGGTGEGREVAELLWQQADLEVVSSLAGRVLDPVLPVGSVRSGGFGGPEGLATWLRDNDIEAVIDSTHPFAADMTRNAARAAASTGIPLIVLHRPPWTKCPGDRWTQVPDLAAAAEAVPGLGGRAFLTIGRQQVRAFAGVQDVWFLVRSIDPPDPPLPARHQLLLARGPLRLEDERELLQAHHVDVLVTKDSGGTATEAKLVAARERGLPVVVVARPPLPAGVETVGSAQAAVRRLREMVGPA